MIRFAIAAAILLAGCASPPVGPGAAPSPPVEAPSPPPPPPSRVADACGAAPLQSLIGRPRSEIPVPVDPDRQRVACTTCPVTQDYRPERLNFLFDAATGVIKEIRCG